MAGKNQSKGFSWMLDNSLTIAAHELLEEHNTTANGEPSESGHIADKRHVLEIISASLIA